MAIINLNCVLVNDKGKYSEDEVFTIEISEDKSMNCSNIWNIEKPREERSTAGTVGHEVLSILLDIYTDVTAYLQIHDNSTNTQ
ncbi:6278_t:CDS:2 [Cetraspora pellucida]|uniref:6278_t:CDS:1 n=1 Tax=Cetraspora pellucida TaxID=1433469 RepID=A0A9N9CB54_9GLOM|nr:6278_t:CDS:2 [Cetraspora pellucida]